MLSSNKTEHRALNRLESIINEHPTMDHQFNGNDKEMCWDGFIWLFKGNHDVQSAGNFDARIPVQIKGHNDPAHKYFERNTISYPVRLVDLEAYATEKGVLYFQIFIDGREHSIFYASLFPSKIADYLEAARKKGNKSTYHIPFRKLDADAEKLYVIAKQFDNEARKQGSAYTPLVQDRIKCDDFSKLKSVTLTAVGASDSYSVLKRLSSGDICLYGRTDGDKYDRPLEWLNNSKFFVGSDVHQEIAVGDKVFYRKYRCIVDSDGGMIIRPSPNLEIRITEGKLNFTIASTIEEIYTDARFILSLNELQSYSIAGHKFPFKSPELSTDSNDKLKYIIDLYETLEMLGLAVNVSFSYYTGEQQRQLVKLINLRYGAQNNHIKEEYSKFLWTFDGKYVPLLIWKENGNVEIVSTIYSDKFEIFLPCSDSDDEKGYKMPKFFYHDEYILCNLYRYDYEAFRAQIDHSDINSFTSEVLLQCVLLMINVFDRSGDTHFLELAEYLLQKLDAYIGKELALLNKLQIHKRNGALHDTDIILLNSIKSNDEHILFGKSVLLEDRENAKLHFAKFPVDVQEQYKKYPIYKLFIDL